MCCSPPPQLKDKLYNHSTISPNQSPEAGHPAKQFEWSPYQSTQPAN